MEPIQDSTISPDPDNKQVESSPDPKPSEPIKSEPSLTQKPESLRPSSTAGKKLLMILIGLLLLAVGIAAGYYLAMKMDAKNHHAEDKDATTTLTIPKEATVTAECVDGRGKQFVVPKNIPDGPIYDQYNGKVVAVEYLVNIDEISKMPEKFASMTIGANIDHVAILPMDAHAGVAGKHVHVVAYMIPASEAQAIKCSTSTPTTSEHGH